MKFNFGDRVVCKNHYHIDAKHIGVYYPPLGVQGTVIIAPKGFTRCAVDNGGKV